jgi:hypothetical protein
MSVHSNSNAQGVVYSERDKPSAAELKRGFVPADHCYVRMRKR